MLASPLNIDQELIASRRTLVNSDSREWCLVGPQCDGFVVVLCNRSWAGTASPARRRVRLRESRNLNAKAIHMRDGRASTLAFSAANWVKSSRSWW